MVLVRRTFDTESSLVISGESGKNIKVYSLIFHNNGGGIGFVEEYTITTSLSVVLHTFSLQSRGDSFFWGFSFDENGDRHIYIEGATDGPLLLAAQGARMSGIITYEII